MAFVERLWALRMFAWFVGIVSIVGLLIIAATISIHRGPGHTHLRTVAFGSVFAIAGYATCIMATMLTATLNRDRSHLAYIWTRPMARERIALGYIAVDVVTILVAYTIVAGVTALVLSNLPGTHLVDDPNAAALLLRFAALPLMWYALVEAATSWNTLRGGTAAGLSWAVFWGLLILAAVKLPVAIRAIVAVLNIFNPLAYFINEGQSTLYDPVTLSQVNARDLIPLSYTAQTILAYAIFIGGCTVAAYAWKRMEA